MRLAPLGLTPAKLASNLPAVRVEVSGAELLLASRAAADEGARLAGVWASDERDRGRGLRLWVLLQDATGLTLVEHAVPGDGQFPSLAGVYPAAVRMERAAFDLVGVVSDGDDRRRWLRHACWADGQFPLRRDFAAAAPDEDVGDAYPFVRVEGDGVHEIAVGPVHAGIIEPGHFRFQVVGEKVLRLEERLGYVHKGVEKRFEALPIAEGCRLAGRVSGDSTVAYALAYAHAAESAAGATVPPRAQWLRALALERERIANHLGDLGYLGNDGGFAFGLAQFSRLREDVLRTNLAVFGHRLAMDFVVPGGVARDIAASGLEAMARQSARLDGEIATLRSIYDEHAGLQDRFDLAARALTMPGVRALREAAAAEGVAAEGRPVDYLYEPDAEALLASLLPRHVEAQVQRSLYDSAAAEQAARMTSMEAATKNAGDMIDSLTMLYNRTRQAGITKELLEIVSGAQALAD